MSRREPDWRDLYERARGDLLAVAQLGATTDRRDTFLGDWRAACIEITRAARRAAIRLAERERGEADPSLYPPPIPKEWL